MIYKVTLIYIYINYWSYKRIREGEIGRSLFKEIMA